MLYDLFDLLNTPGPLKFDIEFSLKKIRFGFLIKFFNLNRE